MELESDDFKRCLKEEFRRREKSIKLKFAEKLSTWAKHVDFHGISNLVGLNKSPRCLGHMWLICFMTSSIFCFYSILWFTVRYFEFNVFMNVAIEDRRVLTFPALTICNLNAYDKRQSDSYIDRVLSLNNIAHSNETDLSIDPQNVYFLVGSAIAADVNLTMKGKKKLGYDLNYMFLTCIFDNVPCNVSDFVWFYDFDYGNCYTFNSGRAGRPIKTIGQYGSENGFDLQLFLGDEFEQSEYTLQSGARVVVHDQSYRPLPKSDGIDLSTNFQTNLKIRKVVTTRLSYPYGDCVQDIDSADGYESVYFRAMFKVLKMTKYQKNVCLNLCQQDYTLKMCSCLDASLPIIYPNETICSNISAVNCALQAHSVNSFVSSPECNKGCPNECESLNYELKSSRSRYPTSYYSEYLRYQTDLTSRFPSSVHVDDNYVQKNIIRVNVYFEHLSTTRVYETPEMTSDLLLANIGAFLILFLGGSSFLTFLEFLEIFYEYCLFLSELRNHQRGSFIHF
jgi:hypothetical protein